MSTIMELEDAHFNHQDTEPMTRPVGFMNLPMYIRIEIYQLIGSGSQASANQLRHPTDVAGVNPAAALSYAAVRQAEFIRTSGTLTEQASTQGPEHARQLGIGTVSMAREVTSVRFISMKWTTMKLSV
jgi:hypothetical protein